MMKDATLTQEEKKALLELARSAIANGLGLESRPSGRQRAEALNQPSGAFVTLHKKDRLRGCIGRFTSDGPLFETVESMARAAAFEDPRFPPLSAGEFQDIDIEISVLTPMREITSPDDIEVGKHGLYIMKGGCCGVLLPQVATEQGWNRDQFLDYTCIKAGLKPGSWCDPDARLFIFSAEVFGEKGERA